MKSYRGLAEVYDQFMEQGPLKDWLDVLQQHPGWLAGRDVADLGCGTGALLAHLPDGFRRAYGVDNSADMLAIAAGRTTRRNVQWLLQDVRDLILPGPVHLAIATCDVVNYLPAEADVRRFLQSVHERLRPGGLFLFDALGPTRVAALTGASWFDLQVDAAVLVDTAVDSSGRISYEVSAFVEEDSGLYRRTDESHEQQFYSASTLIDLVTASGLLVDHVSGDFGRTDITEADRVVFYTRRPAH